MTDYENENTIIIYDLHTSLKKHDLAIANLLLTSVSFVNKFGYR